MQSLLFRTKCCEVGAVHRAGKSFATALLTFSTVMDTSTGMNISKFFKEVLESKDEVNI